MRGFNRALNRVYVRTSSSVNCHNLESRQLPYYKIHVAANPTFIFKRIVKRNLSVNFNAYAASFPCIDTTLFSVPCQCSNFHGKFSLKISCRLYGTENGKGDAKLSPIKKEKILTIPNILTVSRMLATPWLGYLVIHEQFSLAFGVFVVAGVTDVLDGFIARNFPNQMSVLGSFIDPLADKFLISVLTISLSVSGLIPVALTSIIVGRDIFLIFAAAYVRYHTIPSPKTMTNFFDPKSTSIGLHPTALSKANTFIQLALVAASISAPVMGFVDHTLLKSLWYVTGGTTMASLIDYCVRRNQFINASNKDNGS